ncbi:MAG: KTSC domain-containing protein [Candidatus Marinimicrobia bacterium]|nr:KTSC domain-containing protein [Candidatus Neomarinimicrobiota bacterium]
MKNGSKWLVLGLALAVIGSVGCGTTRQGAVAPDTGFTQIRTDTLFSVKYLPEGGVLTVVLTDGTGMDFSDVPAEVYEGLVQADDKDAYYAEEIAAKFEGVQF